MYASAGEEPTTEAYDLKSSRPGNSETIRVRNPAASTYYILVVGENTYRGVTIQARVN